MSTEQRENLDAILRQSAFPADSGEPSAELRATMAGSEVRLFIPYQSM